MQFIRIDLQFKIVPKERSLKALNRSRWPVHVAAVRDNHTLKSLVQNVHRGMRCVTRSAILLESHIIGIHIIHFRPQEVAYHRSVALAVNGYGNALFVLEEVRTDDSARPKSAPNSNFLGMHLELVYLAWIGIIPNSTILLIHISIHSKNGPHR